MADYRERVEAGTAPPETVSLSLTRTQGFLNHASAGSGHAVVIDEPADFGGTGLAADPAELLLAAMAASLSVTLTAHAELRGIAIEAVALRLSAWMDPAAFFDPACGATAGIQDARVIVSLRSPAAPEAVRTLIADAARASPVIRSLARPPIVEIDLETMP